VAVGAPAVYDKDGHKLRAEVGRNIAAGIFWAKTRYRSAPPSSTMSAAPPGGIKHDVKRIMRDEIPLQQHAHDLSHSRLEPDLSNSIISCRPRRAKAATGGYRARGADASWQMPLH